MSVRSCENALPAHRPSGAWSASSRAPQPSVATLDRSAATTSAGSWVRSRMTCQRIEGSESSNQSMTVMLPTSRLPMRRRIGPETMVGAKDDMRCHGYGG